MTGGARSAWLVAAFSALAVAAPASGATIAWAPLDTEVTTGVPAITSGELIDDPRPDVGAVFGGQYEPFAGGSGGLEDVDSVDLTGLGAAPADIAHGRLFGFDLWDSVALARPGAPDTVLVLKSSFAPDVAGIMAPGESVDAGGDRRHHRRRPR